MVAFYSILLKEKSKEFFLVAIGTSIINRWILFFWKPRCESFLELICLSGNSRYTNSSGGL